VNTGVAVGVGDPAGRVGVGDRGVGVGVTLGVGVGLAASAVEPPAISSGPSTTTSTHAARLFPPM